MASYLAALWQLILSQLFADRYHKTYNTLRHSHELLARKSAQSHTRMFILPRWLLMIQSCPILRTLSHEDTGTTSCVSILPCSVCLCKSTPLLQLSLASPIYFLPQQSQCIVLLLQYYPLPRGDPPLSSSMTFNGFVFLAA